MKKPGLFLIPILIFAVVSYFGTRLFASGAMSPAAMVAIFGGIMILMAFIRPKSSTGTDKVNLSLMGELAMDAFANDEDLRAKFNSAVADYAASMPKACLNKLSQLEPQCKTDADIYAVTVMTGMAKALSGDFEAVIKLYNKAVILCPTPDLAGALGSAHQRLGELDKAIDAYEFALDLDPENLDARSALATAFVANGDFEKAIDASQEVLDRDETNASALATIAICHGVLGDDDLSSGYTEKAVAQGYKRDKIAATIPALKKKFRK